MSTGKTTDTPSAVGATELLEEFVEMSGVGLASISSAGRFACAVAAIASGVGSGERGSAAINSSLHVQLTLFSRR